MNALSGDGDFKGKQFFAKGIAWVLLGTACILSVPLVAMQLTDEVDWKLFDFLTMGVLLVGTGFMFVVVRTLQSRVVIGLVLGLALLLTWAELAVGVFGTPFAGS